MTDEGMEAVHQTLADLRDDASHDLGLLWSSLRLGFEAVESALVELRLGTAQLDGKCTAAGDEALALRRDAEHRYATLQRRLDEVVAGEGGAGLLDRQAALESRLERMARELETLRAATQGIPALSRQLDEVRATAGTILALRSEVDQLAAATGAMPVLAQRIDAAEEQVRGSASTAAGNPVPPPQDRWVYPGPAEWVEGFFVKIVERRLSNTRRWCSRWAEHEEARVRLQALWRSWEQSRASGDPLVMSAWYLDHLDRHLTVLLGAEGPFAGCQPQRHNARPPLDARPVENAETITRWDDVDGVDEDRTQEVRIP